MRKNTKISRSKKVEDLRNIGSTIASRLNEIGVYTEEDLRSLGAIEAHQRIREKYPEKTLPVCYYLYSFDGALEDVHWDDLPESRKKFLRKHLDDRGNG